MTWGAATIENMTDASGELVLDEGQMVGTVEDTDGVDLLRVGPHLIDCAFEVEANPDDSGGVVKTKLEIATSDDDITYSSWALFRPGIFTCRYYKMKATVWGDPVRDVRPKITRFEHHGGDANTEPVWPPLEDELSTPPASTACLMGESYLVGASATGDWAGHDGERAYCSDSVGPEWVFFHPTWGQVVYLKDEAKHIRWTGSAWEDFEPGAQELDDLTDVSLGGELNGDLLVFNSGLWENKVVHGHGQMAADGTFTLLADITDLGDVDSSMTPSTDDVLTWDGAEWTSAAPPEAGIEDPATKIANDILQYGGAAWDAVGGAVGDPAGDLFLGAIVIVGSKDLKWNSDGGGNIGAPLGVNRPDTAHIKTAVIVGAGVSLVSNALRLNPSSAPGTPIEAELWYASNLLKFHDGTAARDLLHSASPLSGDVTGTPGANTVGKIQGNTVQSGTPTTGDVMRWTGSQWEHVLGVLIRQRVRTNYTGVVTTTATIPGDDTIPQSSEGATFMSQSFTPKSASSILKVRVVAYFQLDASYLVTGALFLSTESSARAAGKAYAEGGGDYILTLEYEMASPGTSAIQFVFRAGANTSSYTLTFNGRSGGRFYGGVCMSFISIEEYE